MGGSGGNYCYLPNVRLPYFHHFYPACSSKYAYLIFCISFLHQTAPNGYTGPLTGHCRRSGEAYDYFDVEQMFTGLREGPEICATFCEPYIATGYVGFATKNEEESCSCYFDSGTMPDTLPEGATRKDGRFSVGPVNGGSGVITEECYPYLVRYYWCFLSFVVLFVFFRI